ncbi:MAG: hypothetical protein LKI67_01480 [Olsenella sp.]|jgi:hypothetical protein|nr:hypothetical protein [Olsenella sp.]MCI1793608.1 hypothetical protein [Olsenella sp.]MCI1810513.1 hypothetical protein [Olsenella sp.]
MAKKPSAKARKANEEAVRQSKLDERYGKPLFSLTYEMNEYELARAANLYGPDRMKDIFNGAAILSLALLILVLVTMRDNIVLDIILLVIAVIASSITTSWSRFVTFLARKSTLGLVGENNRHHIVVTEDKVVDEGPDDRVAVYPLSELKHSRSSDEATVADFGDKRCVYIPRAPMREGRYQALVRFFLDHEPKKGKH